MGYYDQTEYAVFKYLLRQHELTQVPFRLYPTKSTTDKEPLPHLLDEGAFCITCWDFSLAGPSRPEVYYQVTIHSDGTARLVLLCTTDGENHHRSQDSYGASLAAQLLQQLPDGWEQARTKTGQMELVLKTDIAKPQDLLSTLGSFLPTTIAAVDEAITATNALFPNQKAGLLSDLTFKQYLTKATALYGQQEVAEQLRAPLPGRRLHTNRWSMLLPSPAIDWEVWQAQRCIALQTPAGLGNLRRYKTRQQLATAFAPLGTEWDLDALDSFRHVKPGDVILAFTNEQQAVGLGIVTGRITYQSESQCLDRHSYPVYWAQTQVVKLPVQHFPVGTAFVRAKNWDAVEAIYSDSFPSLRPLLQAVANNTFARDFPLLSAAPTGMASSSAPPALTIGKPGVGTRATQYWWLNISASVWRLADSQIGQTYSWATHTLKGTRRRGYEQFATIKPGDHALAFETQPDQRLKAELVVVHGLHENEEGQEIILFRVAAFLPQEVGWETLQPLPTLGDHQCWQTQQDPLMMLSVEQYEQLRATAYIPDTDGALPYVLNQATQELLMPASVLQQLLTALRRKKNLIIQGPPGVGKTFVARRLAWLQIGYKVAERVKLVQFHQSYSYEDFIRGWRPQADGQSGFELANGVFLDFVRRAQHDPQQEYFFIIDEINRGNLSKIFGELLLLLESDKRGPEFAVPLTYRREGEAPFYLPANLYVIGTMNTADRSLALVDYALRRRFTFLELSPVLDQRLREHLQALGVPHEFSRAHLSKIEELNRIILADKNLGRGFLLGHSYFCTAPLGQQEPADWWREIVEHEIRPLLREYWFEDEHRADQAANALL